MKQFLQKNPGVVATVVIHVLTAAVAVGYFRSEFQRLRQKVEQIDSIAAAARETRWIVDQHGREIAEAKLEQRRLGDSLAEIRADVRVVAAWVRQQQDREGRTDARKP